MNSKCKYKLKSNLPVLVVLTVLTLFSSCSVRKSIQVKLDIPVTKPLSPSKTIFNGEQHCDLSDNVILVGETKKIGFEPPIDLLSSILKLYLSASEKGEQQAVFISEDRLVSDKVPIYILYKKMKLWV